MVYLISCDPIPRNKKPPNIIRRINLILLVFILLTFFSGCASLSPLSRAIVNNDVEKIKTLVNQGANINEVHKIRPHVGTTALSDAVEVGNHNAVQTLLELGANPNIYSTLYAETPTGLYRLNGSPLMQAVLEEDIQIVEMLLKAGADANAIAGKTIIDSSYGYDSLGFISITRRLDIAKLLIKYGADVNLKYENKMKVAYEALAKGFIGYVILLIENGLEIESDPQYKHYNAELAHIAADYYASSNEEKALQLYKQAIAFYPQGIKNYESIAVGAIIKEYGKVFFANMATIFYKYAATERVFVETPNLGFKGPGPGRYSHGYSYVLEWNTIDYDPDMTQKEYYRMKAKQSERNYNLCKKILNCYEENKPNVTLVDCVKNAEGKL